jgi:hypothetical protein
MVYNGYKYTTEQAAINAVKACNDYWGIPKSHPKALHKIGAVIVMQI